MSNYLIRLNSIKAHIEKRELPLAVKEIEDLLYLLKVDYLSNVDPIRSKEAFNKLARVRKELKEGIIGPETNKLLKKEKRVETSLPSQVEEKVVTPVNPTVPVTPVVPQTPVTPKTTVVDETKASQEEQEENKLNANLATAQTPEVPEAEEAALENATSGEYSFHWSDIPAVTFEDIAGLHEVKELVKSKVLDPIRNPESLKGYVSKGGGGVTLYGPPGTGKTMIAAATANAIHAKFCAITPSEILQQGVGSSERALKTLFAEARKFPCAMIFFDEIESLAPKNTRSTVARNLRSEFLAQLEGVSSYGKDTGNILFLMCATNKPWDVDSAFLRPGRFGTKIYVGLPDEEARGYIISHFLDKIKAQGIVKVEDIDLPNIVALTNGLNGADMNNLNTLVEDMSRKRYQKTGEKTILNQDYLISLASMAPSVQAEDIEKLMAWRKINDINIVVNPNAVNAVETNEETQVETVEEAQEIPEETVVEETQETPVEEVAETVQTQEVPTETVVEETTPVEENPVQEVPSDAASTEEAPQENPTTPEQNS